MDDDPKVIEFPKTAEERRALHKAKQTAEQQKLVNAFMVGPDALFATADGVAYADLIVDGHRETWPIRSKQFRYEYIRYVKRLQEQLTAAGDIRAVAMGQSLKKSAINAAIDEFEIRAIGARVAREVYVRVAAAGDDIYIDLGDPDWHAVRVTASSWSIVQSPPVRFRRSAGMLPLPFPERGTSIDKLRPFLNIGDRDFVLVVAYLLAALRPEGPYPILGLVGEHGVAKTSFLHLLRSLVDPSMIPTSPLPSSGRDLFITAHNSHVQAFENVSKMSAMMSDHLCRLATGSGFRTRALFKDADETLLRATRPIMLEGIANVISRPDLMSRTIALTIDQLTTGYKTAKVLKADFEKFRPGLFGALLDHLVMGIRQLPNTHLANAPRMADFATWAVACGLDTFESAYASNRQSVVDVALEHDLLACAVQAMMAERKQWDGTASNLLDRFGPAVKLTNSKVLSEELRRLAPLLRTVGIDVQFHHGHAKRGITITRLA